MLIADEPTKLFLSSFFFFNYQYELPSLFTSIPNAINLKRLVGRDLKSLQYTH